MANSAIRVVGRLDPAEAARPEYGFLPPAQRQRATLAKPGTMFVIPAGDPGAAVRRVPVPGLGDPAVRGGRGAQRHAALDRAGQPTRSRSSRAVGGGITDDEIPF